MSTTASHQKTQLVHGAGDVLAWLGGGHHRDIGDDAERASYQSAGFLVLLNALIAWTVATIAVSTVTDVNALLIVPFTLVFALVVGAVGRVVASSVVGRHRRRFGDLGRGAVAVLLGLLLGELAVLALFTGPINRQLHDNVDQARATVAQSARAEQLNRAEADLAALHAAVADAIERRDYQRIVARCEYNPTADCPAETITGDPGRAAEARQADDALAAAESDLADARDARDAQARVLGERIGELNALLSQDRDRAEQLALADRGLDARWRAMHEHTSESPVALALRIGVDGVFVVLAVLPLLLRRWRGETAQDRRILARRLREDAQEQADTTIAIKQAQVREALAVQEAEALLSKPQFAAAEKIDPELVSVRPLALTSGEDTSAGTAPAHGGDLVRMSDRAVARSAPGPLDGLPGPLPKMARAVTAVMRPLVPDVVAKAAAVPANQVRKARTLLEEVEELTFSFKHSRKVTVSSDEEGPQTSDVNSGERSTLSRSAVATRILDSVDSERLDAGTGKDSAALSAQQRRELPLGETTPELRAAERRELPPGSS